MSSISENKVAAVLAQTVSKDELIQLSRIETGSSNLKSRFL